jgi:inner membrane transporter RhtA
VRGMNGKPPPLRQTYRMTAVLGAGQVPGSLMAGRWPKAATAAPARSAARRAGGPAVIMSAAVAAQLGDGLAVPLFSKAGPLAIGSLRFLAAAILLLAVTRPSLRGRARREWLAIAGLGCVAAAMNLSYYEAAARLPLGTASTIEFLGPFAIAAAGAWASRSLTELLCAAAAAAGVGALSAASLRISAPGLAFAVMAAACLAGYVLLGGSLAQASVRLDSLALATGVAAVVTLPTIGPVFAHLGPGPATRGLVSGWLGIAVVYALERQALRLTSAKTVSVLLSLEPAAAALVGYLVLGQRLTPQMITGMACVLTAATVITARTPVETRPARRSRRSS